VTTDWAALSDGQLWSRAASQRDGEEVNAAVILQPGQHATEASLQEHCRAQLSAFEIPKKIYFLDRFPRTTKGDGDRRALAAALTHP
jgi:oxalate---CoA ligase